MVDVHMHGQLHAMVDVARAAFVFNAVVATALPSLMATLGERAAAEACVQQGSGCSHNVAQ